MKPTNMPALLTINGTKVPVNVIHPRSTFSQLIAERVKRHQELTKKV